MYKYEDLDASTPENEDPDEVVESLFFHDGKKRKKKEERLKVKKNWHES